MKQQPPGSAGEAGEVWQFLESRGYSFELDLQGDSQAFIEQLEEEYDF